MWALYGWLLAKGVEVYMNKTPTLVCIPIYPEIVHKIPDLDSHIVRYVLNVPGVMGGVDQYGNFRPGPTDFTGEKVYYFSRLFGQAQDDNHYMFLPAINLHIFKDQKKKRTKTCYLVGKGVDQHKHPEDSIELNRTIARDQQALADILNECHTFYCYDKLTAMMECSRLCGCKVEYHGGYTMEELKKYEPGRHGINMLLHTELFRAHYEKMILEFEVKLETFIDETQDWG